MYLLMDFQYPFFWSAFKFASMIEMYVSPLSICSFVNPSKGFNTANDTPASVAKVRAILSLAFSSK